MSLGLSEIVIIFVAALLIFGPRKLPELGRQLGKAMTEFRRASNEFKWQLEEEMRHLEENDARGRKAAPAMAPPEGTVSSGRGAGENGAALGTEAGGAPAENSIQPETKGPDA